LNAHVIFACRLKRAVKPGGRLAAVAVHGVMFGRHFAIKIDVLLTFRVGSAESE
jgi:hypothetical protein